MSQTLEIYLVEEDTCSVSLDKSDVRKLQGNLAYFRRISPVAVENYGVKRHSWDPQADDYGTLIKKLLF